MQSNSQCQLELNHQYVHLGTSGRVFGRITMTPSLIIEYIFNIANDHARAHEVVNDIL